MAWPVESLSWEEKRGGRRLVAELVWPGCSVRWDLASGAARDWPDPNHTDIHWAGWLVPESAGSAVEPRNMVTR